MSLTNANQASGVAPIFALAFRPFFLFGPLFSIVALLLWGKVWFGGFELTPYGGWFWWHGHEMLMGFVAAIVSGFLLTAVQNWTGRKGLHGFALAALFAVWLLARVLLLFPSMVPSGVAVVVDLSFLPLVAMVMGFYIYKAKLWRNFVFVPLLLVLTVFNTLMHKAAIDNDILLYKQQASAMVLLFAALICLMGGRVIPMFTANGTASTAVPPIKVIELGALLSILSVLLGTLMSIEGAVMGVLCTLAFGFNLARVARWRSWTTLRHPLLWSLHLGYALMTLSFLLLALFYWGEISDYVSALHTLTIGGISLIALSMIARVSLGHTGREITCQPWVAFGFALIAVGALVRVVLPLLSPSMAVWSYGLSIGLWTVGFGLFVCFYFPILSKPRVDGKPG